MALVWDQGSFGGGGSTNLTSRLVANDFTLTSAMQLTQLRVWMSDGVANNNGLLDSFGGTLSFAIYTNNGGQPGTLIYSSSASVAGGTLTLTDSGADEGSFDIVRADLSVSGGQTLNAGSYFLVVHEGAWGAPSDGSIIWWGTSTGGVVGASGFASATLDGTGSWAPTSLDYAMQIFGSAPPVVSLFNGETVSWNEGDAQVRLDLGQDATAIDSDSANLGGGGLDFSITAGLVVGQDKLGLDTSGAVTISGSNVLVNGIAIGTIAYNSNTNISIDFTANATTARVQTLLHFLSYTNTGGDAPTDGTRTISYTLADDAGATTSWTSNVLVTGVDDPSTAVNDSRTVGETQAVNIAVLANDSDPDGQSTLHVAMIAGNSVSVGDHVTLASGATVTLLANGKLQYDTGHAFDWLTSAATGAATGATSTYDDHFAYSLDDGATAVVTVTVNGIDTNDGKLSGDAGNNTLTGTSGKDIFLFQAGGNDHGTGGDGDDVFYFGASLSSQDWAHGDAGNDTLALQGNYGSSVGAQYNLGAAMMTGVETLLLMSGSDGRIAAAPGGDLHYYLRENDANVAAGAQLTVQGSRLGANEVLYFNGAAETDGSFKLLGGAAADTLIGGAGDDWIAGGAGWDTVTGGAGNDIFYYGSTGDASAGDRIMDFTRGDHIDLRAIDAIAGTPEHDSFSFIGTDNFHGVAGELRLLFSGLWLVSADVDGDGVGDLNIYVGVADGHTPDASDFLL